MSVCFSSMSQVMLASGESQSISNIDPYEQLLTLSGIAKNKKSMPKVKSSPFYTYIHYEKDASAEFIVLTCEQDLQLVISEAHLLFKKSSPSSAAKIRMAREVEIGDYLVHVNAQKKIQDVKVIAIERKEFQGVFAPLTNSGTLIVDGFLVSCYAHVDSHTKAHASLAPLRFWYQLRNKIGKCKTDTKPRNGVHVYARTLASFYKLS